MTHTHDRFSAPSTPPPIPSATLTYGSYGLSADAAEPRDRMHLKLLMIFHYVVGGVALGSGVHMFLVSISTLFMGGGTSSYGRGGMYGYDSSTDTFMTVYMLFFALFFLVRLVAGPFSLKVGRGLRDRRNYAFCLNWSVWQWFLLFPEGIPLGVCTRNVLRRASVHQLFVANEPWR